MRVCLINPPHPYLKQPTSQAPLGLLYLASSLIDGGVDVSMLDLSGKHHEDEYKIPDADIYGITGTVLDRNPCMHVADEIRKNKKNSRIVVGGPISLTPQFLDFSRIDSVLVGEGEVEIFNLLGDFPNLKEKYIAERILDVDSLKFPSRDLLSDLGGNIFAYNKTYVDGGSTVLISSRGCPYNCAFCASPGIWKRKVTFRSAENVIEEVKEIKTKYNISQLRFNDDSLTLNEKRLERLCNGLRKLDVIWRASIRVRPNSIEMFKMMYDSGCREVSFGVESADPYVLDTLKKGNTVDDNYQALINAKKAGLVVRILFMTGTPGETEKTTDLNIAFLEKAKKYYDTIALTNFIPIPGSEIAEYPDLFSCRINDYSIDHYNFYMWGPSGLNVWENFISIDAMSDNQLKKSKKRMRDYIINCGKSNQG